MKFLFLFCVSQCCTLSKSGESLYNDWNILIYAIVMMVEHTLCTGSWHLYKYVVVLYGCRYICCACVPLRFFWHIRHYLTVAVSCQTNVNSTMCLWSAYFFFFNENYFRENASCFKIISSHRFIATKNEKYSWFQKSKCMVLFLYEK